MKQFFTLGCWLSMAVVILISRFPHIIATNLPTWEIDALHDIYVSTAGVNWSWNEPNALFPGVQWNFTGNPNPCADKWQGVNCTSTEESNYIHVFNLGLTGMNMEGTLPGSIGSFPKLRELLLAENLLSGPLPRSVGNLANLEILNVSFNQLQAQLPRTLEELGNLTELAVQTNIFTGPLLSPDSLTQLTQLNCGNNFFNETIPAAIGDLRSLQVLMVQDNLLTGSLPDSLGQLTRLVHLDASYNTLSGWLPDSLGQLGNLEKLMLGSNFLTGEIPPSLGKLRRLTILDLFSNTLHSAIPPSLGNLTSLQTLSLHANHLHGTIPNTLCNITALQSLLVMNNMLTGQIPACLVLNPALNTLKLYNNRLSGPLPDIYAPNSQLSYLDVNGPNFLTGTLPSALGQLPSLQYFYAGLNHFTGSLPAEYGSISNLLGMYLKGNALSSTLPSELGSVPNLVLLELSENRFTGTLPESWAALIALQELFVDSNYLTGTIPVAYMELVQLVALDVHLNDLHGSIPNSLGQLTDLQYLSCQSNMLTGSIPEAVGNLTGLRSFEVNENRLTGRLPGSLSNLTALVNLLVNNNHLTGSLDSAFDSDQQSSLIIIQLSDNEFTGTLPEDVFRIQRLATFAAVSNCFEGSLPLSICDNSRLKVLALSGLQTSSSCQRQLLPGISKAYISKAPMSGGIPSCLFEIPSLTQLQLSGNGLTGTLPDDVAMSPTLLDISLSHNALTGTLPLPFQQREWLSFDVSYNRLYGSLNARLESESSALFNLSYEKSALSLENNRLSGRIPNSVKPIVNVSMLSGNLFSCSLAQTDLPQHDPAVSNYQCGSSSFDVPYYAWIALVVVIAVVATVAVHLSSGDNGKWVREAAGTALAWYFVLRRCETVAESHQQCPMLSTRYVMALYDSVNKIALICAAYALFVLLPLYAVLSTYYGTLQHQYAYAVSAAFHQGKVAVALEMVFLILLQCMALGACVYYWRAPDARVVQQAKRSASVQAKTAQSSLLSRLAVYCTMIAMNMVVVFGVNIAYVYVVLYESNELLLFAQILLSVFKLGWNKFCGSSMIPWTARLVSPTVAIDLQASAVEFFPVQLFLSLFNTIAIPCLVVALVNPNCFSYVFSNSPTVTVTYLVNQCETINDVTGQCTEVHKEIESTTFNPPFTYSYQCSASFVTYYAPAFVIMCIMSTFASPALQTVLVWLYNREAVQLSSRGGWRFRLLDAALPKLLKPPTTVSTSADLDNAVAATQSAGRGTVLLQRDLYSPHFPADLVLLNMLTFLGVLLTFGAVFPPLAVALAGTVIGTAVYARLKMGRFLTAALDQRQFKFLDLVDKECAGVGTPGMLVTGVFMLLSFSCAFYTLFLFDALGDSVGLDGAYWVLIVVPLVPAVLYAAYCLYSTCTARCSLAEQQDDPSQDTELSDQELPLPDPGARASTDAEVGIELSPAATASAATATTVNVLHAAEPV